MRGSSTLRGCSRAGKVLEDLELNHSLASHSIVYIELFRNPCSILGCGFKSVHISNVQYTCSCACM